MEAIQTSLNDVYFLAAICATQTLRRKKLLPAIASLGSAKAVYEADAVELRAINCFQEQQIQHFLEKRDSNLPLRLKNFCEHRGVELLSIFSDSYPESLRNIADPPLVLYVLGKLPSYTYGVAIVGSRNCSAYGEKAARKFGGFFAKSGIPIISGGALGIDTAAHESCLEAGGQTIAVLGCGIDVIYPSQNRGLFQRIAAHGAVITEYAPGTGPLQYNFPARNRIVVGLSQAVVVAEARRKSGALITAHLAADEGRDVYAVPGDIFKGYSLGCHDLIRKGATPVDFPEDILQDAQEWQKRMELRGVEQNIFSFTISPEEQDAAERERIAKQQAKQKQLEEQLQAKLKELSEAARKIYEELRAGALSLDEIIDRIEESFMTVSMAILELQVANLIREDEGHRYHRI